MPAAAEHDMSHPADLSRALAAVARQDRAAYARLFTHIAPRLKTFLMHGGLPGGIAEEIVQETMLTVWRRADSFDPARGGATTWIFTIARNLRTDFIRRSRRGAVRAPDPADEPQPPQGAEDGMMAAEREQRVRAALAQLSEDQAMVLRLSFFSDIPHAEISRVLGIPLGTVKSRVRLAVARLRTLLDDIA